MDLRRTISAANVNHYNVQPVFDVYANVQDRDLAAVAADVQHAIDVVRPSLPRGASVAMRGQVETMNSSFTGLATGLVFALLLVYLLMVVNFQSWLDPFIILTALPGVALTAVPPGVALGAATLPMERFLTSGASQR